MSIKKFYLMLPLSFLLQSCVFDIMPLSYRIRNCTKDTLFINMTNSKTLTNDFYWKIEDAEKFKFVQADTTSVRVHGEKVVLNTYYQVFPDSTNIGIYPLYNDSCIVYSIKKEIIKRYTFDEIRRKRLYDRQTITEKDFHDRIFEYRFTNTPPK